MTQFPSWVRRPVRASYQGHNSGWGPASPEKGSRVYAIAFDLDTDALERHYHGTAWRNAYADIGRVLDQHGFRPQQGSVYFGAPHVTPVHCILAVQDIQKTYPWFAKAVKDIRMLRIEEDNDLMPAIAQQDLFQPKAANG
jgi:virulence-associated protein VapD